MTIGDKLIHSKLTMGHGKCQTDAEVRAPRARVQWGDERSRPPTLPIIHIHILPAVRVRSFSSTTFSRRSPRSSARL